MGVFPGGNNGVWMMLLEAKEQVAAGRWGAWLGKNFDLSRATAWRYMRLAEHGPNGDVRGAHIRTLSEAVEDDPQRKHHASWHEPIRKILNERLDVEAIAQEKGAAQDRLELLRHP